MVDWPCLQSEGCSTVTVFALEHLFYAHLLSSELVSCLLCIYIIHMYNSIPLVYCIMVMPFNKNDRQGNKTNALETSADAEAIGGCKTPVNYFKHRSYIMIHHTFISNQSRN